MRFDAEQIRGIVAQFLRFGMVGCIGLVVDTACVYALRDSLGLYWAGALSFPVAASVTWAVNRVWTFRGRSSGSVRGQWIRFLGVNAVGFVINRGTYFALVTASALCMRQPFLAVAAGAVAGMFLNFGLSRRLVFR